jgi:hypothetical protein
MNRNGWRVLLLHPPLVSHDFIDCAEFHYDLSQFVSQIVDEQHRDKVRSQAVDLFFAPVGDVNTRAYYYYSSFS